MARAAKIAKIAICGVVACAAISACSSQGIQVPKNSPYRLGAELFLQHCSGCHTMSLVGAEGSATAIPDRLKNQAPNFDYRKECVATVLYAIRNGGFSGQIMPENVLVGSQAVAVAEFLQHYAGYKAPKLPTFGEDKTSCTTSSS